MKQSKRKRDAKIEVESPAPAAVEALASSAVVAAVVVESTPAANAAAAQATAIYKFAASCTVRDCVPLKTALGDFLDTGDETILDVSAIERVDAAAMQLLYAFVRERKERGGKVSWVGDSPSFFEAVRLLGLAALLDVAPRPSEAL